MFLRQITDAALAQNAYLIGCQRTGEAIVIDPERDVDRYLQVAAENGLRLTAVAETHIHADYLSGARELMERHGMAAYLPAEGGPDWQFEWAKGHPQARFLRAGDEFRIGNIAFKAVASAGHTPEHLSYLVTDEGGGATEPIALCSGDFIFVGDVGRPDLLESAAGQAGVMEPSARALYASLRATAALPEHLQILPAHGAGSACGKALGAIPTSVLGYERRHNRAFRDALEGSEDAFVKEILAGQPEPPLYFARMKRDNRRGPVLLPGGDLPQPRRITVAELGEATRHVLLDLRHDRSAFRRAHVRGSLLASLSGGNLPIVAGSYVQEGSSIVLLVNDPAEVNEAVRQLVRIGLDEVVAWLPVEEALRDPAHRAAQKCVAAAQLGAELGANPGAAVLDVRGAWEFAEAHVVGAVNVPHTRLAARLKEVPAGSPLFVHCHSGQRAGFAVPLLERAGFPAICVEGRFEDIPPSLVVRPAV